MSLKGDAYPRDMIGYGRRLVNPQWPGQARIALQIALNYEGGAESSVLHGDAGSEAMLTDAGLPAVVGQRSILSESSFEYGSRCGVWRLLRMLRKRNIKISVFAVAMALERNLELVRVLMEEDHEIVSHGWRWIDYQHIPEEVEREHVRLARDTITRLTGKPPLGWMTGRPSPNTRRLLVEEGGFLYDRDALNDELPYWLQVEGKSHLIIPYSYETNDNRFNENSGFSTSEDYFQYMKDAFDVLYDEGDSEPKMMSLGLHDRLIGRPGRAAGFARFLDYVLRHDRVWICRGIDIAQHWVKTHPFGNSASAGTPALDEI